MRQLDQKGPEQQLVEAYSQAVNGAALSDLKQVFCSVFVVDFGLMF